MIAAVLLDSFATASLREARDEHAAMVRERRKLRDLRNPMEPLLAQLAGSFSDDADLSRRLASVYQVHPNASHGPGYASLSRFPCTTPSAPTESDVLSHCPVCRRPITQRACLPSGQELDPDGSGGLSSAAFCEAMRRLVRRAPMCGRVYMVACVPKFEVQEWT